MMKGDLNAEERRALLQQPGVRFISTAGSTQSAPASDGGNAGVIASIANLANAAIGAGILAFPYAFLRTGIVLGPLLTAFFAILLGSTLHVIGRAGDYARRKEGKKAGETYQAVVGVILGDTAEKAIIVLQALYLTGCCIVMLMIVFEQVEPVLKTVLGEKSKWVQTSGPLIPLVSWLVCFPLSLIRKMEWFSIPSTLSQLGIFFTMIVVVVHSVDSGMGAANQIKAGPELQLDLCAELTEENWVQSFDASINASKLIFKGTEFCATANKDDSRMHLETCSDGRDGQLFSAAQGVIRVHNSSYCLHGGPSCGLNTGSCQAKDAAGFSVCIPADDKSRPSKCTTFDADAVWGADGSAYVQWKDKRGASDYCLVVKDTDKKQQDYGGDLVWFRWGTGVFIAIPLICFGFQCHLTYSLVYDSLAAPRNLARMDTVSIGCMATCFILYATTGVFGYALFGEATGDDILEALARTPTCSGAGSKLQIDVTIARICVAVKVACSYGMLAYVTRKCMRDLLIGRGQQWSSVQFGAITVTFNLVCMICAMYIPGISVAMGFSGVLVMAMIMLYPGALLCTMREKATDRVFGVFYILFGVVIMVLSLVVEVLELTGTLK